VRVCAGVRVARGAGFDVREKVLIQLCDCATSLPRSPTPTPTHRHDTRAAHNQGASGRGRGGRAAVAAASERAALHQSGTVALMAALPKLLGSFQSEPEVVSCGRVWLWLPTAASNIPVYAA